MKTKHTPGPFTNEIRSLEVTLESEQKNTAAPGNPYLSGLSGRIGGMKQVLSHPLYAAAPEMFNLMCEAFNSLSATLHPECELKERIGEVIDKARGES